MPHGQMTKTPFSGTMERATDLLEIIHTDVCGRALGGCAQGGWARPPPSWAAPVSSDVGSKSISMEFLHELYTNMTQTAVPQISCTIIINFASFGINIMYMCITTIEIQQTIFIGCMTIEGFIHVNRTTIIL